MDVSSIRSLMTLVVQLHTIIIFAQALSEGGGKGRPKPTTSSGSGVPNSHVPCCRNGGLCVLGSFCHCPKNFYGRYCEYELKKTPCRHIPHGSWVKAGCNLCRCFDGHMTCLPRAFDGCDDKPQTEKVNPWDYRDEMVIISRGGDASTPSQHDDSADDNYHDYYDSGGGSGHSSASTVLPATALTSVYLCVCWTWVLTTLWTWIIGS